jgi:chemotaxis family two-component system response regulator Rcp1
MSRIPHILFVAPAVEQRERFAHAVAISGLGCVLHGVSGSPDAFLFLMGLGSYADSPRPKLIVIELRRPDTDGWGLLSLLKNNLRFSGIPVVVMTDSENYIDVLRCGGMKVDDYVTIPETQQGFIELIGSFDQWLVGSSTGLSLSTSTP